MKQFRTVLGFELKYYFKNKVFVGVTIALVLLIAGVMFFPRIAASFDTGADHAQKSVMLVSADFEGNTDAVPQVFAEAFPGYEVTFTQGSISDIQTQITDGDAECAFVLSGLTAYTYYVNNLSMYDQNTDIADAALQSIYRADAMIEGGIPADRVGQILSAEITHETESLGKDQFQNFFYTYIMIFALYMVILLYGQMVATNVASEKSSRAMELLITSVKPNAMMFGKVIASCMAGLLQLICVFGSAFLFFRLNKSSWGNDAIINSIFNIPMELLLYMILFFILGFFLYAFMYGAIGSTASKVEDINTSVMPITMLFIVAFIVVMISMGSGNIDNTVMKVCSYIPFTSPMAMFTRIAMSTVAPYEIMISVAVLIVTVFGVGVLSAKIYRVGVLLYGTTPKIGSVLKSLKKA